MTISPPPVPGTYASTRDWSIPPTSLADYPHLLRAWRYSQDRYAAMTEILQASVLDPRILTIALSGSLGRMEGLAHSDADLIVVVQDSQVLTLTDRQAIMRDVWSRLEPLQLPRPAADGIFIAAVDRVDLCDMNTRGVISESPPVFGTRIQLLLDSQPVVGRKAFDRLLAEILTRYSSGGRPWESTHTWDYLMNDLIRYYRCLALDAQWRRRDDPGQWRLFQLKLAHSRRLLYAGLLLLLAESSRTRGNRVAWVQQRLKLTPMERVAWVMAANAAGEMRVVAEGYNRFLGCLQDAAFRDALRGGEPASDALSANDALEELMINGQRLAVELLEFVISRRGVWSDGTLVSLLL